MRRDIMGAASVERATEIVFGSGGPLRAAGLELRPSQRTMALEVARRIDSGGWSMVQAPTGTGKGAAYLIPGIIAAFRAEVDWRAGRRPPGAKTPGKVVVSTANIALQGQMLNKDIPVIARVLGANVRAVGIKGRQNYLCRLSLESTDLLGSTDRRIQRLRDWSQSPGCSGDREDLDWDPGAAWREVSVMGRDCIGDKCRFFRPVSGPTCFAESAHAGVERAHVVVLNHYILPLLPVMSSVLLAVDEGHELESCVRKMRSLDVSQKGIADLGTKLERLIGRKRAQSEVVAPAMEVFQALEILAERDPQARGRSPMYSVALGERWDGGTIKPERLNLIRDAAKAVFDACKRIPDPEEQGRAIKVATTCSNLHGKLVALLNGRPPEGSSLNVAGPWATWVDVRRSRRGTHLTAKASPADVGPIIKKMIDDYPAAVIASATLTAGGAFDYIRASMGVSSDKVGDGMDLPSPYDLPKCGVIVVPRDAPDPKDYRAWQRWAPLAVRAAVHSAQGRTLVLSTSRRMMDLYTLAIEDSGFPVRSQGSAGRAELIRWFTEQTSGVLIGTRSFFQGLDVPGESLSCVVVDRVPFTPPGDPLEDAIGELVAERSNASSSFWARSLPRACMVLAQASGRLIRSSTDRGAVVLLDRRIVRGSMSKLLRAALPPFPLSHDMDDVGRAIAGQPLRGIQRTARPRGRALRRSRR